MSALGPLRRLSIVFSLLAAAACQDAVAQSRPPNRNIQVDVAPLRANAGEPTASWVQQALSGELARVLAPGGLLVLRVSALDLLRSRHSQFTCERQRFTRKRLLELAARHGIRVLRCTYANTILFPVALAKFRLWEPLTHQAPQSGVRPVGTWLNRVMELPLAAEGSWVGAGMNLPVGQSLILAGEKAA